jgi:hypothetical protein
MTDINIWINEPHNRRGMSGQREHLLTKAAAEQ